MSNDLNKYFYRYRSSRAVLEQFHEIERGEIYFSLPGELNDPMEGFKDVIWLGDEIVWSNFLRHYLLCVLQAAGFCFIAGEQFNANVVKDLVFWAPQELPEAPIRDVFDRVSSEFIADPVAQRFVSILGARTTPIRRNELTAYLRALHGIAMYMVLSDYRKRGMLKDDSGEAPTPSLEGLRRSAIGMMEGAANIPASEYSPERVSEALFAANESVVVQMQLINECNLPDKAAQNPLAFLAHRFPEAYVSALDKLVHFDWYVSCFTKTPENHSMWSTYADGHRGVCLMFKASLDNDGKPALAIERTTGAGSSEDRGTTYYSSFVPSRLEPVSYSGRYPIIDFFRSLGSIREVHLNNFWFRGENETFSACRDAVYSDNDSWREQYWRTFSQSALCKTPEWAHEQEYRIVVHSMLFDMSDPGKRKLKYRFEDLAGIVFGARTEWEDKVKIVKIIEKKCVESRRDDFKFYQVRYIHGESRFQLFPLDLLKMKHE